MISPNHSTAPEDFYPDFLTENRTNRESWRTKQALGKIWESLFFHVLDYVFLWSYVGQSGAKFFMQLEDDVISLPKSGTVIKQKIDEHEEWFMIEFSTLGSFNFTQQLRKLGPRI